MLDLCNGSLILDIVSINDLKGQNMSKAVSRQIPASDHERHSQTRTQPGIDRRVARTRGRLQSALNQLILKQAYESISVEGICAAAKVGRSTFYLHFINKDDLKRSGLALLQRQLSDLQKHALISGKIKQHQGLSFSLMLFICCLVFRRGLLVHPTRTGTWRGKQKSRPAPR